MPSVLQEWVAELPLREQAVLLTAVRGCDVAPKRYDDILSKYVMVNTERQLVGWIRWAFMVPADPTSVGQNGAFMQDKRPSPFRPDELGHYPQHWYSHVMHALEILGNRHPDSGIRGTAWQMYCSMADNLHLRPESPEAMTKRLRDGSLD